MIHRGEIVEKAVRESGIPLSTIAKKLGRSRRWMYLMFQNPQLSLDTILEIGKIIHFDFGQELKELKLNSVSNQLQESQEPFVKKDESSPEYWKNKYLTLLEEYSQLLRQMKH